MVFLLSSCDEEAARRAALLSELDAAFAGRGAADGFDFPVGPPDGRGYYVARGFGELDHLGEDWNGAGGGHSDRGDPIHAAADGYVVFAADHGGGWGNVVRIVHLLEKAAGRDRPNVYVETLYAHFLSRGVKPGDFVRRAQVIGTMGDAGGLYYSHLHFEVRSDIFLPIGGGYGDDAGFREPTVFIKAHRPRR